jgi:hypothetical protein
MFFVFHLLYVLRRQASELFGDNSNVDLKVMGRGELAPPGERWEGARKVQRAHQYHVNIL